MLSKTEVERLVLYNKMKKEGMASANIVKLFERNSSSVKEQSLFNSAKKLEKDQQSTERSRAH